MKKEEVEIISKIILPIFTFVLAWVIRGLTMTKKERKDHLSQLQENSNKLSADLDKSFQAFTTALNKYTQKTEKPILDEFFDISTKGESYFSQGKIICDSILSGNIEYKSINNTHVPIIIDIVEKTLPNFYTTLQEIAQKSNIEYAGTLKRENYKSIYEVYDKYKVKIT